MTTAGGTARLGHLIVASMWTRTDQVTSPRRFAALGRLIVSIATMRRESPNAARYLADGKVIGRPFGT